MHEHDPVREGNHRDRSLSRNRKAHHLVLLLEICIIRLYHALQLIVQMLDFLLVLIELFSLGRWLRRYERK